MTFGKKKHRSHEQHEHKYETPSMHAPLKYLPEDKTEKNLVHFKITQDGEEIKESVSEYENGTREELLLTIRDFCAMASTYDLWTELAVNNVYGKFRRCLKGEIRGSWDEILEDEPRSEDDFQDQLILLAVDELGMNAHKNQVKYLRRTKKPENMPVQKWFKRIRFINRMLPLLSGGATVKSDEYLLENFVLENIPNN